MIPLIYFIIPVRHHATVRDWGLVQRHMAETLASIAAQTAAGWECRLVASHGSALPDLPTNCTARFIDLPPPKLPDARQNREAYIDVVRQDRGLRTLEGVRDIPPDAYVMPVDYDDFISGHLVEFVIKNQGGSGWYFPTGYLHAGGGWTYLTRKMWRICGTSHIIRRDVLGTFTLPDGTIDMDAVKRRLGAHIFNKLDLADTPDALAPLPFPGAVYRIGNAQSAIGNPRGLFRTITPPRRLLKQPRIYLPQLWGYRPMTAKIRQEFSLPPSL
jgi:hypothetical protein